MALSTRELFLILRARDEASRTLGNFSKNLTALSKVSSAGQMAVANDLRARIRAEQLATASTVLGHQQTINALTAQRIATGKLTKDEQKRLAQARLAIGEARQQGGMRVRLLQNEAAQLADTHRLAMRTMAEESEKRELQVARQQAIASSLAGIGVATIFAGGVGLKFAYDSTKAFTEYQKQVALTRTQIDQTGVSLKQIADIGKRIGAQVGAPFEELQASLYDIFSSMDVSVVDSETLLRAFAKTAVAGQVSIQTSGRATIAIMNAFHVPAKKVNDIMDFQFQLVRKGVGTYEQFASTIGRSIPSAARAGQSYQQLGGMLAFLTRNGLSAAMATASAGRALDAISNSKTVGKLSKMGDIVAAVLGPKGMQKMASDSGQSVKEFTKSLGVSALDAKGRFRPLVDIINEMQKKLAGLTDPQRAAALQSLFAGSGGTIQARRFFDLVLKSGTAAKQFTQLTKDMYHATGVADSAYKTMADTAATRTQLLKNRWEIFKVQLGEQFLPVLIKLIGGISRLLAAWNSLNPTVKRFIGWALLITSVLLVVIGIVMTLTGVFILMSAAAVAAGTTLGAVAATVAIVIAVIVAVIVVVVLLVKHWGTIKKATMELYHWIADKLVAGFNYAKDAIVGAYRTISTWTAATFGAVRDWVVRTFDAVRDKIVGAFRAVRDWLVAKLSPAFHAFSDWFDKNLMPIVRDVIDFFKSKWTELKEWWHQIWPPMVATFIRAWALIEGITKAVWNVIKNVWQVSWSIISGITKGAWKVIVTAWNFAWMVISTATSAAWGVIQRVWVVSWQVIKDVAKAGWDFVKGAFNFGVEVIKRIWFVFGDALVHVLKAAWELIKGVIGGALQIIEGIIQVFVGLFTGDWHQMWLGIKKIASGIWSVLKGIFKAGFELLMVPISVFVNLATLAWQAIEGVFGKAVYYIIVYALKPLVLAVLDMAIKVTGAVSAAFGWVPGLGPKLKGAHDSVVKMKDGIERTMNKFAYEAYNLGNNAGKGLGEGFATGIDSKGHRVAGAVADLAQKAKSLNKMIAVQSPSKLSHYYGAMFGEGFARGIESSLDRVGGAVGKMAGFRPGGLHGMSPTLAAGPGSLRSRMGPAEVHQTFNIKTQEISPEKHSADLGWLIGQKVGA